MNRAIPDTSVIINGKFSKIVESGELAGNEIVIPLAVIDELQAQASKGREVGFKGLEEVKKIRELAEKCGLTLRFSGERPSIEDIKLAKSGRIDAMIRDVAKSEGGTLYTSDYVQALVAEAEGIPVKYLEPYEKVEKLPFEKYLAPEIHALYLKAGMPPHGKQLMDGELRVVKLADEPCTDEDLNAAIEYVFAALRGNENYNIALFKTGAIVIDSDEYRISIAKPPFSDGPEITIQRNPLNRLIREEVFEEIIHEASNFRCGVLVVNCDGIYTYPIAKLFAKRLHERGKIVKILGHSKKSSTSNVVSYYGPLDGDLEKAAEFILLSGADCVVFEEIRKTRDLKLVQDVREMGLGVIAFIAMDDACMCLRKIIEHVGLTSLPSIIKLFACIKNGKLELYRVDLRVKAPTGLSPMSHPKPVISLSSHDEVKIEAFEIEGRVIVQEIDEATSRISALRVAASELMKEVKKIDARARLKSIALDRIVIKVSASKLPRLLEISTRSAAKIGVPIEFIT